MNEQERIEVERRLQPLLGGGEEASSRREVLRRIACDDEARNVLADMLEDQVDARAAFGYDGIDEAVRASWNKVKASLPVPGESSRPGTAGSAHQRPELRLRIAPWLSAMAATVVMAVSLYVALTARSGTRLLEEKLTRIEQSMAAPAMAVSEADMAQLSFIWSQVAQGSNTWVLVSNGKGEFGNIASATSARDGDAALLLQCRILDEAGRLVYVADLLMPSRTGMSFRLVDAGRVAGRPASMDVATADAEATVALSVGGETGRSPGVAGQTRIGEDAREIGRFRLDDETLRVYVRSRHLPAART